MAKRRPDESSRVLDGIAAALWLVAWTDNHEGQRIPATPHGAKQAAEDFGGLITQASGKSLSDLLHAQKVTGDARYFGECLVDAWVSLDQGEEIGGMIGGALAGIKDAYVPVFRIELTGDELVWEGRIRTHEGWQKQGRKPARRDIAAEIRAAHLHPTFAGLNADWSRAAWHLGPSDDPNRVDGDYYIVEDEDEDDNFWLFQYFPVAEMEGEMDQDEARVEIAEGPLEDVIAAAREALILHHNPPAGRWPSSDVASLLFPVGRFSSAQAKAWAKEHGFKATKVDTTKRYHRLRQFETHGEPCRTVHFGDEVQAVVCRAKLNPDGCQQRNPATRMPTLEEIAGALRYIEGEFRIKDGVITGEMWAEGLALGRDTKDPDYAEYAADARQMQPQLTDDVWKSIAARADYLRSSDFNLPPRFAIQKNPGDYYSPGPYAGMTLDQIKAEERRQIATHRTRVMAGEDRERRRVKAWEDQAAFDAAHWPRTRAEIKPRGR